MLASFLSGEFLVQIPCCLQFYARSLSYTLSVAFFFFFLFIWGVFLTNPMLVLLFIGEVSLTHPVLASFLSEEFLLHIPRWLHFYAGSFSYTSRAVAVVFVLVIVCLLFIWGVYLTHLMLLNFFFFFKWGSFSYTSRAGFFNFFIGRLSLTHLVLASFLSGEFLLHTP